MTQPIWLTPPGSLGTIPEGRFYQLPLKATNSEFPNVRFKLISGRLPAGIQVRLDGTIEGIPEAIAITQGVPLPVSENVTSKFTVRAFTEVDVNGDPVVLGIADRTFTLTVTGQDVPEFITPPGNLGYFLDATKVEIPIEFTDDDPDDEIKISIARGELPPGLSISTDGVISGIIEPVTDVTVRNVIVPTPEQITYLANLEEPIIWVGQDLYDLNLFDSFEYDFPTQAINKNFEFTIEITDGKDSALRTFSIFVSSRNNIVESGFPFQTTYSILSQPNINLFSEFGFLQGLKEITDLMMARDFTQGNILTSFISSLLPDQQDKIENKIQEHNNWDPAGNKPRLPWEVIVQLVVDYYLVSNIQATTNIYTTFSSRPPFILNQGPVIGVVRHDNYFAYQFKGIDFDGDPIEFEVIDETNLPPGLGPTGRLELNQTTGWLYGYIPNLGAVETSFTFHIRAYKKDKPHITSETYQFTLGIRGNIESEIEWVSPEFLGILYSGEPSPLQVEARTTLNQVLRYRLVSGSRSRLPQGIRLTENGLLVGRPSFNTLKFDGGATTFDSDLGTRLEVAPTTFDTVYTFEVNAFSSDGTISVFKTFKVKLDSFTREPWETVYIQAMPPENDRDLITQITQDRTVFFPGLIFRDGDPRFGVANKVRYTHLFGVKSAALEKHLEASERNHYRKKLVLGEIKTAQALDENGNVIYEVVYSEIQDDIALINERVNLMPQMLNRPVVDGWPVTVVFPNSLNNMRNRVFDVVGQAFPALPLWMRSKQLDGRVLGFTPAWVIAYVKPGAAKLIKYRLDQKYGVVLNTVDFEVDRYIVDREQTVNWDPSIEKWAPFGLTTFDRDSNNETIFDGGAMRFVNPVDNFGLGTAFDKYVVFPNRGILE